MRSSLPWNLLCAYSVEGGTKLLSIACLVCNRYFLQNWPQLAFLAYDGDHCFGTVVCKMDVHREQMLRGYLAMLVVEKPYRSLGTGMRLLHHCSHLRLAIVACTN